jgi:hypothetical protein
MVEFLSVVDDGSGSAVIELLLLLTSLKISAGWSG